MSTSSGDHTLVRRRQHARLELLKRRITVGSLLGFAALFALAAQHTVRGSSATTHSARSAQASASAAPTTYFDQQSDGFAFDDGGTQLTSPSSPPSQVQAPPVAQTSVS